MSEVQRIRDAIDDMKAAALACIESNDFYDEDELAEIYRQMAAMRARLQIALTEEVEGA